MRSIGPALLALAVVLGRVGSAAAMEQSPVVSTIAGPINASGGIAADEGTVFVADFGADLVRAGGTKVYRLSQDGTGLHVFAHGFGGASGNTISRGGILYQADIATGRLYRVETGGCPVAVAEGLQGPVGIAIADSGTIYVAECRANAIARIEADGRAVRIARGAPLDCPNGLTVGSDGALYTANFRDGNVVRIAPEDGAMRIHAVIAGGGNGHIDSHGGRLYVASFRGNRIYAIDRNGSVAAVAGSGAAGNADGPGAQASFFRPNGLSVGGDGRFLFVNSTARHLPPDSLELHPNLIRVIDLGQN